MRLVSASQTIQRLSLTGDSVVVPSYHSPGHPAGPETRMRARSARPLPPVGRRSVPAVLEPLCHPRRYVDDAVGNTHDRPVTLDSRLRSSRALNGAP